MKSEAERLVSLSDVTGDPGELMSHKRALEEPMRCQGSSGNHGQLTKWGPEGEVDSRGRKDPEKSQEVAGSPFKEMQN